MLRKSSSAGWMRRAGLALLVACAATLTARPALAAPLDQAKIAAASGAKATATPEGVVRIAWARTDVKVTVDGMAMDPFAGLGSWAAFSPMAESSTMEMGKSGAMVMGDTVVFEDEVNPAMDAAFAAGLDVTALHNHFFHDQPKAYFMHIGGQGDAEKLARGVKAVWDAIKAVRAAAPAPAVVFAGETPQAGTIDPAPLEKALGKKADIQNGVVKFTLGREGKMHGETVGGAMGLTTWVAFSGSDDLAAIDGDVIMTAEEVQPVLRALRKAGINVVALHNHMIGEQPAFFFTHFWAKGAPDALAKSMATVLNAQKQAGNSAAATP